MFNCEASKQASGLGLMLSAKIYILSWKVWNKTFYCGSQTRIIADYTRNQIVFMRPLTYQNPVSKRVYFILWNKISLKRRCGGTFRNRLLSHKEKYLGGLTPGDSEKVEQKRVTETIVGGRERERVFHTRQEIANFEWIIRETGA